MIRMPEDYFRAGVLLRGGSFWIGAHWSKHNKRLCLNLVPFVTIWFTLRGGYAPKCKSKSLRFAEMLERKIIEKGQLE